MVVDTDQSPHLPFQKGNSIPPKSKRKRKAFIQYSFHLRTGEKFNEENSKVGHYFSLEIFFEPPAPWALSEGLINGTNIEESFGPLKWIDQKERSRCHKTGILI